MRYTVIPEEDLKRGLLLEEGEGQFEVMNAIEKTSAIGNEMIELQMKVWDKKGKQALIYDYLVSIAQWKIHHFLKSIGSLENYLAGDLAAHSLIGSTGTLMLKIEKDPKYGEKNKVADYIEVVGTSKSPQLTVFENVIGKTDDEIPF